MSPGTPTKKVSGLMWRENMAHKRSPQAAVRRLLTRNAFHDPELAESINRVPRRTIIQYLRDNYDSVEYEAVPWFLDDDNCGEVISDSRGRGCLQITR